MESALPRPSGWPDIAEKILKIFIDHKLLAAEIILKNTNLYSLSKNGCGPATPQQHRQNLKIFIDHKLIDLFKKPTLKIGVVLPRPSGWPKFFENIYIFLLLIISYMIQKEFWFQTENRKHTYYL